ncbi:MAG: DUF4382 domain-containing protein [Cyanobacteria bacterium J06600_6]
MNTNKVRIIAYGITLGSIAIASLYGQNTPKTIAASTEQGTLSLTANGEDFVREGFVSKDGWSISFDNLYVNVGDAIAYAAQSSFEPEKNDTKNSIEYQHKVALIDQETVTNLAAGEADADPIVVSEIDVQPGFYNALAWDITTAEADSIIAGKTMNLLGQATKDGETIDFDLSFNQPTTYVCGEFVGDQRLGMVEVDTPGTVEMTFHFDHVFGDADTPPEDALNQHALGFQPLANLASNDTVKLDEDDLAAQLSAPNYQRLQEAIAGLGHVGEGHCVVTNSQ